MTQRSQPFRTAVILALFTTFAILVAGYHSGIEDDAIYQPAIKKLLNPALFPFDSQFFASQTHAFPVLRLVAASVRLLHVPLAWALLIWQVAAIAFVISGSWQVAAECFTELRDRIGAVALAAGLLTLPVAGTSLYIADQHLHPRTFATGALLFAIAAVLRRRFVAAGLWSAFAIVMHPLMGGFGFAFVLVLALPMRTHQRASRAARAAFAALPLPFILHPNEAWREAAFTRDYYFLLRWHWYEWLGIFGPMAILYWFSRLADKLDSPSIKKLSLRLILYSAILSAVAMVTSIPARLVWLAPTQPMRHLQLVYLLMLLIGGGLLAHYVLRAHVWRWLVLFVPLGLGMFYAQRELFPASAHIEFPGARSSNRWVRCFQWIRDNTPTDAYFALDPAYMASPDEENFGFRAIAERSKLADLSKDPAVVALAPDLAPIWKKQVDAARGWSSFQRPDFIHLKAQYGVNWVVLTRDVPGLPCPYSDGDLRVCRIE